MRELRKENGISMKEAARRLQMPYTTYVNYEKGMREPNSETLIRIAEFYKTSIDYLLCNSERRGGGQSAEAALPHSLTPYSPAGRMPLLGHVAAGLPLFAEENICGYIANDFTDGETYYGLVVHGDSMSAAGIDDGDTVVVRQQSSVDDGQIAVVLVGGEDATIKYFRQQGNTVILMPKSYNPVHQPQIYDLSQTSVRIIGRVVEARKMM
jgi:repressor LexA